jgi:predicted PurR-regulated permease PerM
VESLSNERPRLVAIAARSFALGLGVVAGIWLLAKVWPTLLALVVSLVLFGTFNPLVKALVRRGWRRGWATGAVVMSVLLVATGLALATMPSLWGQVVDLARQLPALQAEVAGYAQRIPLTRDLAPSIRQIKLGGLVSGAMAGQVIQVSSRVLTGIGYAATALVLAIYFLANPSHPQHVVFALTPRRHHVRLARVLRELQVIVGGYVRGQLVTSAAIFVFALVLLSVLRVPNALALAAFAGLTDVLPFVGGLLATTPAALSAIQRGPWVVFTVVGAMAVYQEIESRLIVPRVYGRVLRLSPPAVILSLLIGGELMGIMGALLALPFAASIRMLIAELRVHLPGERAEPVRTATARDSEDEELYAERAAAATIAESATIAGEIVDEKREGEPPPARH